MAKVINQTPNTKLIGTLVGVGVLLIIVIAAVVSCLVTVPTGHTGILTTFGKVEDQTLESGMHFKLPWQSVVKMDNRNQKQTIDLSCFSSDIQEVAISFSINYQIQKENAQTIYKTIGTDYYNTVMTPKIQSAVKKYVAQYTAEKLIESRELLSQQITESLTSELAPYNIILVASAIENMDFNDAFTDAVEAKQVAAQNKLQAEIEQEKATMEATQAAERAAIKAKSDAEVAETKAKSDNLIAKEKATTEADILKVQADAAEYQGQKDATINKAIAESLTPELIQYYYITYWDGKLPDTYVSNEDFLTMLQLQAGKTNPDNSDESTNP